MSENGRILSLLTSDGEKRERRPNERNMKDELRGRSMTDPLVAVLKTAARLKRLRLDLKRRDLDFEEFN